jgi:uncharacterized protein YjbI with pentapeptide repeats
MELHDTTETIVARACNLAGSRFEDIDLSGTTFANVNMTAVAISDANMADVEISHSATDDMTIDGVRVADLFAAYRSAHG